jgi:hypothetical protein
MGRHGTAWLLLLTWLVGCGGAQAARVPDPGVDARRFAIALRDDQPDVAYALLDRSAQQSLDRARFQQLWRENRIELQQLGAQLARSALQPRAHAQLDLESGERVVLVLEDGQWRVQGGLFDAQALSTPLDSVLELRRALQRQSLPSLLRVLSHERRAAWLSAFDKTVQQTRDPLDLRVEVHDDEAIVHITGGGEIHLKREAGQWHVWDVR